MEKRVLIAIILSLAVLLLWQALFPPPKPQRAKRALPPPAQKEAALREGGVPPEQERRQAVTDPLPSSLPAPEVPTPLAEEKEVVVETDLYVATFSTRGARLKSLKLRRYSANLALPKICFVFPFSLLYGNTPPPHHPELKELIETEASQDYPLSTFFEGPDLGFSAESPFTPSTTLLNLDADSSRGEITFSWTSTQGVSLLKKFVFSNESYFIDYQFTVSNDSSKPIEGKSSVEWIARLKPEDLEKKGGLFGGVGGNSSQITYLVEDDVKRKETKDIQANEVFAGEIKWAGFEEKYFLCSLIPPVTQNMKLTLGRRNNTVVDLKLLSPSTTVPSRDNHSFDYALYLGPKDMGELEKGRGELGRVLNFGWLDPIAKPMLFILKLFYKYIPNYGLAVIVLSIGIKVIFWPLTHKSQTSMKEMQKIQPKLAELKEKHKNDKEELNRKTLELYRTHKVNPLGGCLPILIQIPVFFALYRVLLNSIELRHAPFVSFWINDLAAKDPTYISPLFMGASMFLQQKMTPTAGDPTQAKMMLLMPVVFTFLFLSFPSGLVIYWLINNVLSIGQQYYINKRSF
jgi:YidC/Oxa1 family membrane protein insertase